MASPEDENSGCTDPMHANSAMEKLAGKVDGLLTGGLHGEFYEESRTSGKNRHQQLSEMFELRQLFQEFRADQQKILRTFAIKEEQAAAAAAATTKGGGLSANNVAAIEAVVHRLTADKFRDMSLLSQRLKDSEKENAALKKQIEELEFRFKTRNINGLRGSFPSMNQHNQMVNKVAKLEEAQKHCEMHRARPNPLEAEFYGMRKDVKSTVVGLRDLRAKVLMDVKQLEDRIAELESKYKEEAISEAINASAVKGDGGEGCACPEDEICVCGPSRDEHVHDCHPDDDFELFEGLGRFFSEDTDSESSEESGDGYDECQGWLMREMATEMMLSPMQD
ncbi:hypothetical protein HII31_06267 [Pseudocercospora fuligena]|uniref:Uncharacterized protein n=1 Tax=Pseudocercospora fuligena TaxID=685502 RepID=A0A8H6VHY7_9PEZI|nr:hypothetical protein HII31_06267 [Pseudocercospora fuligena]